MSEKNYEMHTDTRKAPPAGGSAVERGKPEPEDFAPSVKTDTGISTREEMHSIEHEREVQKLILMGVLLQGMKTKPDRAMIN